MASEGELDELLQAGFRYALSLSWDRERARDLVQEACAAVVQAKGSWTRAYLFTAIRSRWCDLSRRARLVALEQLDEAAAVEDERPLAQDPQELVATRDEIARALGILREEEREVLYLAAVEDYTAAEIASLTQRPRSTILSMIQRGRGKLRRALAGNAEGVVAP